MVLRFSIVAGLAVMAIVLVGSALGGGSGSTMEHADANGWDCDPQVLIFGYFHCAPPGKPSVLNMINGDTTAPTLVLRVFHPDGSFAGIERLIRADLYGGQPCPQDGLAEWGELPFGYFACHNFETGV